jgi:uncharacterized protein YbcI
MTGPDRAEPIADTAAMRADIAEQIRRVHEQSYGTEAEGVEVHIAGDNVIVVLQIRLAPAERTLIDSGREEAVKMTRESFQAAIAPTFSAIVERATGRRVNAFLSAMSVDPLYELEFFRLAER